MSFWSWLLQLLSGRDYRNASGAQAARQALEEKYPDLEATAVWLQARETDRDVVAVLYRVSERNEALPPTGRPRYKLFAVHPDSSVEELTEEPNSPYSVRGIK